MSFLQIASEKGVDGRDKLGYDSGEMVHLTAARCSVLRRMPAGQRNPAAGPLRSEPGFAAPPSRCPPLEVLGERRD